jgi:transcriptional regulator GlxA family with amidase domain
LAEIIEMRIRRAKELLVDSTLPIAEVADKAGFAYVQQFNAAFKRAVGTSPAAYRRQFQTQRRPATPAS